MTFSYSTHHQLTRIKLDRFFDKVQRSRLHSGRIYPQWDSIIFEIYSYSNQSKERMPFIYFSNTTLTVKKNCLGSFTSSVDELFDVTISAHNYFANFFKELQLAKFPLWFFCAEHGTSSANLNIFGRCMRSQEVGLNKTICLRKMLFKLNFLVRQFFKSLPRRIIW